MASYVAELRHLAEDCIFGNPWKPLEGFRMSNLIRNYNINGKDREGIVDL